jgi:hypothetical protein
LTSRRFRLHLWRVPFNLNLLHRRGCHPGDRGTMASRLRQARPLCGRRGGRVPCPRRTLGEGTRGCLILKKNSNFPDQGLTASAGCRALRDPGWCFTRPVAAPRQLAALVQKCSNRNFPMLVEWEWLQLVRRARTAQRRPHLSYLEQHGYDPSDKNLSGHVSNFRDLREKHSEAPDENLLLDPLFGPDWGAGKPIKNPTPEQMEAADNPLSLSWEELEAGQALEELLRERDSIWSAAAVADHHLAGDEGSSRRARRELSDTTHPRDRQSQTEGRY